jgi:hypothetical protein
MKNYSSQGTSYVRVTIFINVGKNSIRVFKFSVSFIGRSGKGSHNFSKHENQTNYNYKFSAFMKAN